MIKDVKGDIEAAHGAHRERGGTVQSASDDPVPSQPVCVWDGSVVKSFVAQGQGEEGYMK